MLSLFRTFRCMKGFFIKKAFFDGWDNLIGLVIFNLVYIALFFLAFWGSTQLGLILPAAGYALVALSLLIVSVLMGGTASVAHSYSDYKRDSWQSFISGIRRNIRHSLLHFVFLLFAVSNVALIIPFYLAYGNIFGTVIAVVMIWIEVAVILALPYYFPLMNLLPADRPLKTAKKCLIVVGDNMGFTLFYLVYNLICTALSVFTLGLVPGLSGMQLAAQDGMKLLMLKYDYLEENPDADRKHIPWDELLYDEREKVGPRSLKSMIFPWKY